MDEITDSPTDWVAEHTARYLATDGADGHDFYGYPTLLLTTRGRKSGLLRRTPVHYGRSGEDYLLVPANGGADTAPAWYLNLTADPEAEVQVRAERVRVRAREATAEETPAMWRTMVGVYPRYAEFRAATSRTIPVVVLSPTA